ncbi:unnamed protein product [Bursaphelenchus xylophilus]|uniref:(pine wood nematode) hypothetical protein n=1 Tax=Bursaphelenchus xylophilus TaxID=6326 RepID=A0A1I7RQ32_BURXY|nr:unnamed protein product [Bursaphelenchus xylophilus]CAG9097069.1 unnamed protein product [Bursaphelenchus xylophilus]
MPRGRRRAAQTPENMNTPGSSRTRIRPARFTPTRNVSNRSTPVSTKRSNKKQPRSVKKQLKEEWISDDDYIKNETASDSESEDEYAHKSEVESDSEQYEPFEDVGSVEGTSEERRFFPWLDLPKDKIPPLLLPNTSTDLLVEPQLLFAAMEVYEVCYNYYRILQLSPFLFEDFCCALRSPDQSRLLAEINIAFIRLFYRDDEEAQTTFSVQDTNNYFNITLQLLDGMTYGEILRQFVESDKRFDQSILPILENNYPFVDSQQRLKVLKWLCGKFLESNIFRQVIRNDGKTVYDDVCRECAKPGNVILCDGCDACYHVACMGQDTIPEGSWFCSVCEAHDASGATNLRSLGEMANRMPLRQTALGRDRHGRTYWFVARRVFVESIDNDEVFYYSTLPQLYNVVKKLDPDFFERELCESINANLDKIVSQMRLTLKLTNHHRDEIVKNLPTKKKVIPPSYLEQDNSFLMSQIMSDIMQNAADGVKVEGNYLVQNVLLELGFNGINLVDTFWCGGSLSGDDLIEKHNQLVEALTQDEEGTLQEIETNNNRGYRYSFTDGHYREYINEYTTNELAKSSKQRAKEKDKRRYMSLRFALTDENEFVWACPKNKDIYMNEYYTGRNIQQSLLKFMDSIPDELYHRLWRTEKSAFLERLNQNYGHHPKDADESKAMLEQLRYFLLKFECLLRKPVFSNVWWNALGLTRLIRVTYDDKDRRSKLDIRKKKEEKALLSQDPNDCQPDVKFVKYLKKQSQLWKTKNESFRMSWKGGMGGWLWISSTFKRNRVDAPEKFDGKLFQTSNSTNKKAKRLESLVHKLKYPSYTAPLCCYSSSCREYSKIQGIKYNCYSPSCPMKSQEKVKYALTSKPEPVSSKTKGEDAPFPIPEPFQFLSRGSGKRSLLILPQPHLRKLARQGGLNPTTVIFGFNKVAKSNLSVWNYPCPRPLFDQCWRYNTLHATSLHAIALNLRIMYSCLRWADMEPPEDTKDPRVITHLPDHDEVRHIIGHKEYPPDGYYERYQLKILLLALEEDLNYGDEEGKGKKYKKKQPKKGLIPSAHMLSIRTRGQTERWADGVDLKLYEIKAYWRRVLMDDEYLKEGHSKPVASRAETLRSALPPPRPLNTPTQTMMSTQKAQGLKSAFNAPVVARISHTPVAPSVTLNGTPYSRQYTPSSLVVRQNGTPVHRSNGTPSTIYATRETPSHSRDYIENPSLRSPQIRYVNPSPLPVSSSRFYTPDTIVINSQGGQVNGYGSSGRYPTIMRRETPPVRRLVPNRQVYTTLSVKRSYPDSSHNGYDINKENGRVVLDHPHDPDVHPPPKRVRLVRPEPR